jgi:dihydroorotate dehydrogenase
MLIANGLAIWLSAQWGMRKGARWLWQALARGGLVAFACAIGVHFVVGYVSALHLAPAFAGWAIWCLALLLTREWMTPAASPQRAVSRVEEPGSKPI